jgi:hypothetical protein
LVIRASSSRRRSGIEIGLVGDLGQVQVQDVEAVVLGGRAEPDVATHSSRTGERRVEHVDGHVAGADEVDLLLAWTRRPQAQRELADLARDHEHRVQEGVDAVGDHLAHQRRLVDAVHHDQQLVERHAAHAATHAEAGIEALDALGGTGHERPIAGGRRLGALREQPLSPRA